MARRLKWFAIPFSRGPHFVLTLHHDPVHPGWLYVAWLIVVFFFNIKIEKVRGDLERD